MMKRFTLYILHFTFALAAARAWAGFSFDASNYGEGEELSVKGTEGGSWVFADPDEKPVGDGTGSVRFGAGSDFSFAAEDAPDGTLAVYDCEFTFDAFLDDEPLEPPTGMLGAVVPATPDGADSGFYVAGDGRWNEVYAPDVDVAVDNALSFRLRLREAGGALEVELDYTDSNGSREVFRVCLRTGAPPYAAPRDV